MMSPDASVMMGLFLLGCLVTFAVVQLLDKIGKCAAQRHTYDALDYHIDTESYVRRNKGKWSDIY